MAKTYSKIYIQVVLVVRNIDNYIDQSWENELYNQIKYLVRKEGQKLLAINGMPDHVHIFIGIEPSCDLSQLVMKLKTSTSDFINNKQFAGTNFQWDEGFGAFSHGSNQLELVTSFISSQKEHHKKISFNDEYSSLLNKNEVIFDIAP